MLFSPILCELGLCSGYVLELVLAFWPDRVAEPIIRFGEIARISGVILAIFESWWGAILMIGRNADHLEDGEVVGLCDKGQAMGKDSKRTTASGGKVYLEKGVMSDVDNGAVREYGETNGDDTTEDGQSEDHEVVLENVEEGEVGDRENQASAGSYTVYHSLKEDTGEVLTGTKRRRTISHKDKDCEIPRSPSLEDLFGLHSADWEDESDDNDWSPVSALNLRPHWFCINCTMKNSEDLTHCGKCGESMKSEILTRGHLSSQTEPAPSPSSTQTASEIGLFKGNLPGLNTSAGLFLNTAGATKSRRTVIGFDERMLLHYETRMKSHPHPERPDRVRAIMAGLASEGLYPGRCVLLPAREVTRTELRKVHSEAHVDAVEVTCKEDLSYFTPDTYANKDSSLAARLAAGISAELATAIVRGEAQNGFALVRPPGHHAEQVHVMGFCLHNNAAVAAKAAQEAGAKKVLIVDWDVHHGNGTQDIFNEDPTVLYVSLHRHEGGGFYPGTGAASEVGVGRGKGLSVNIPWICGGIGDSDYIYAFLHIVLPIAKQFAPDMTIISAGFDAAKGDPLGGCEVTPFGYAQMTSLLSSVSGGKILVVLEGGYNLRSISASAAAVIKVLLGDDPGPLPEDIQPTEAGALSMFDVFAIQSQYWPSLQIPLFVQNLEQMSPRGHGKELLLGELDHELESSPSEQVGKPVGSPPCLG
ncbi:hypothetical protein R1sor_002308 [Riccia sorocarpa]|uniref:histone deacetylase n=1 Tax=Riccia sorocarpa TaxID=122646 RepID=A0ABD3H0H2_9MARC